MFNSFMTSVDSCAHDVALTGATLHVREYGSSTAPPVILVHGGPGLPGSVDSLARALAPKLRVFEPFQRDRKLSPSSGPFRATHHLTDLAELVAWVTARTSQIPVVIGHSWGALLALLWGASPSGRGHKTLLLCPGAVDADGAAEAGVRLHGRLDDHGRRRQREINQAYSQLAKSDAVGRRDLYVQYLELIYPAYFHPGAPVVDGTLAECQVWPESYLSIQDTVDDCDRLIARAEFLQAVRRLNGPVELFCGESDLFPWQRLHGELSAHVRRYRFHLFAQAGHFPWLESPSRDLFIRRVLEACTRQTW